MNKQVLIAVGISGVLGAGAGFGVGYIVFKKKFEAIAAEEIESVREAYSKNAQPKPSLVDIAGVRDVPLVAVKEPELSSESLIDQEGYDGGATETDAEAFRLAHGRVPSTYELIQMGKGIEAGDAARSTTDHDDVNMPEGNIFDHPQPDPDTLGEETFAEDPRSPDRPYVISAEEWFLNETDYDQITLTYWADDDVLADDNKRMITEIQDVVGATNLHRFGFKSDSPDIVYVRNERLKADYEITKDERNYAEVVHGIDPELVNETGVPRRMRSNDE